MREDDCVAFGDPPPCDHCRERSAVRIVTIVFDAPSPPDQFLCRAHAPKTEAPVTGGPRAGTGVGDSVPRTGELHPGHHESTHPKRASMEDSSPLIR
jgi:hypothetical protein